MPACFIQNVYKFANIQWMIYSSTLHYGEREGNALYWKWDIKTYMQCKSLEEWVIPSYKNGLGLFVLIEKETGTRIGHAGLVKQKIDGKEEIEIGYWLLPQYWGKGYAKEAAAAFRDYGFQALRMNKLISLINPNHPASIFVARKTGLSYEKTTSFHGIDA